MSRKLVHSKKAKLKKNPFSPAVKLQEAMNLHRAGNLSAAEHIYKKILATNPKHGDVLNLLGTISIQTKNYEQALNRLSKAVQLYPDRPDYHSNLGTAHKELHNYTAASAAFKRAIAIQPDHVESLYNLAGVLLHLGLLDDAVFYYNQLLIYRPRMTEALEGLGYVRKLQGKYSHAIECYEKSIQINEHNFAAYCAIGDILQTQKKFEESLLSYQQAIERAPTEGLPHNNMGNSLSKLGRYHEALNSYQKSIALSPDIQEAYINLAWTYREYGMLPESFKCFEKLKERMPLSHQSQSDFLFSLNYDPSISKAALHHYAQEWWQLFGSKAVQYHHSPSKDMSGKLKIGFISPDFSSHPVGFFLLPLLRELDRSKFEIWCYAEMAEHLSDATTEKIKQHVDKWQITSSMSDAQAAAKIYSDKIDILIDLAGHTANNRLMVLAHKPAPVQINWLGYVCTTGLETIDYRLTDAIADPPDDTPYCTEKLIRLPHGFFCYSSPEKYSEIPVLPASINNYVTFGSFNNLPKITPEVIDTWSQILDKTPQSRLLFTSSQFVDTTVQKKYLELFQRCGVDPARIRFSRNVSLQEYFSLLSSVDIGLDPFPHNGHTITCDTLWMGVPVITLRGDRYASRMGSSILTLLGLQELIGETPDEYIAKAVSLANDTDRLNNLRHNLRARIIQCDYGNTKQFARDFEKTLLALWNKYLQSSHLSP